MAVNSRATAIAAYKTIKAASQVPSGWTGSVSGCKVGSTSAASRTATFTAINTYRAMAGLSPVKEDTALSNRAQYAALIVQANQLVTHYPSSRSACYTTTGAAESARANLAVGSQGASTIDGYMADASDESNRSTVGHRRWLLRPQTATMGTASTINGNATTVAGGPTNASAKNPALIPWPSAGYFPWQWTSPSMSWSVSASGADFSAAKVKVTKDGKAVKTTAYPVDTAGGIESLVWKMPDVTQPAPGAVDTYKVAVSGVLGAQAGSFTYEVNLFWVPEVKINTELNIDVGPTGDKLAVGRSVMSAGTGVSPSDAKVTRQWTANGADIAGATGAVLRLTANLECLPIGIRLTASYPEAATVTRSWNNVLPWEGCPAPSGLNLPSAGTVNSPFSSIALFPDANGNGLGEVAAVDQTGKLVMYPLTSATKLGIPGKMGQGFGTHTLYSPGDWTGDGKPDLLTVRADYTMWLYQGKGSGAIASGQQIGHGWGGYQLMPCGDLNGDSRPDLLAVDRDGLLWVYPNNGNGAFGRRFQVGHGWKGLKLYAAGDADRNGTNDIFMINPAGVLYFYAGKGNGGFRPAKQVGHGWCGLELFAGADLTGDGLADILSRTAEGKLNLYPGKGGGAFFKPVELGRGW
ncbi:MAG: FG-GAP-like repeat-containing protein [Bifidobacteriaceae bacterium]|nr:FG-GAP-like repeat-containing protein [Bifidobacteriaceae bacterium]